MKSRHRYGLLYEIAKEITSSLSPAEVLDTIVRSTTNAIGAKGCSLMLLAPDNKELVHDISCGLSDWYLQKGPVRSNAIIKEVLGGKTVAILDATTDPRVQYKDEARQEGIASMLSIPLMPEGEVLGIMRIYTSEKREFSSEDVDLLSYLANLGAVALDKAKLYESLGKDLAERSAEVDRLAEEKDRFLRFLGMAAHDLKAPLTAIQGFLYVMLGGYAGETTDKQKNLLERSTRRINELLNLISDLLDIPRIEAGQIVPEMKEISFNRVVRDCLQDQRRLAKEKGLQFKVELPKTSPRIQGSRPRLQQVLANLVNNAITYTSAGMVTLRVTYKGKSIQVEVMDTGIGIPPEDTANVFDDFFRGSNVQTKGTGLGLSIAKRIVEAHGGDIVCESPCPETDGGSRFSFSLPKIGKGKRRQP